jgi:NADPH-dependent 2,4-dienoyl-CoA reductase/sulfur reductase-like enzyme
MVVHSQACRSVNGSLWSERPFVESSRCVQSALATQREKLFESDFFVRFAPRSRQNFVPTDALQVSRLVKNQMRKTLPMKKTRVLIVGGGFGGIYAALEFEKRRDPDFEITLINQDNFFLFTPMLHEVAASDLDLTHIVNPIRKMLRHVHFFQGEVRSIDIKKRQVVVAHDSTSTHIRWNMTTSYLRWVASQISTIFPIWPRPLLR